MSRIPIDHFHHHIDNGGIEVDIDEEQEDGGLQISLRTRYFGYPDITSTLRTWGNVNSSEFLRELGLTFLRASEKVGKIAAGREARES